MAEFVRSALCRLCKGPTGRDGVRMTQLDWAKLSLWWKEVIGVKLEADEIQGDFLCQFCLWDAKIQNTVRNNMLYRWWAGHDVNWYYKRYYFDQEVIRRCEVRIDFLETLSAVEDSFDVKSEAGSTSEVVEEESRRSHQAQPTNCPRCGKMFRSKRAAAQHCREARHVRRGSDALHCKNLRKFLVAFKSMIK